ncbi:MAG TPA: glutamine--fructose-6-phosphate transaminase (isomerizing) [Acidimicrobiales bacterium]|nr:glutamine--fructose-6-phosphate transaminase (isomerizing) [Acidimicrobiales bacterium]
MCGIIGVTGAPDPFTVLLDGLTLLEYRGYDSAGIALVGDNLLWRVRDAVRGHSLEALQAAAADVPAGMAAGIGHTRWATHGAPVERNAHPHCDCTGSVAIVHNGIIENYRELGEKLAAEGHVRSSETDSEVVAHLLERELATGASLAEAMRRAVAELRGDFALAAVSVHEPDVIAAARRTSPLIVGHTDGIGLVASDISALLGTTRTLYQLADDEIAEVRPGSISVVGLDGTTRDLKPLKVSWDLVAARRDGYDDFMSKEIHEQPRALADSLLGRVQADGTTELEELRLAEADLDEVERVVLIGCGSAYYACLSGRIALERWARMPAEVEIASEFRYRDAVLGERTLVVAVSQSGETVDTFHALREARRRGAQSLALTNVVDSLLAREADGALYTRAGPEIGVASTKCHSAQIAMLELFALHLARRRGTIGADEGRDLARGLLALPDLVAGAIARLGDYLSVASRLAEVQDVYFLGRNIGYGVALEGALKLKELAYVRAEAYPAGEMKHGPIALIDDSAVVVAIATRGRLWEKVMANIAEVKARGATVVVVCDAGDEATKAVADHVLEIPAVPEMFSPAVAIVPLQALAYGVARARGNDVDRPRNLAKVVTVE